MPTRKQRRRNQKARRHEYEYVYVDDAGNEVEVDAQELRAEKETERAKKPAKAAATSTPPRGMRKVIEPPSWRRAGRRALILGPLMIVAMMLLNRGLPLSQQIAPALFLIAFFIPFSYFTDSLAYRMYRKRVERQSSVKTR